VTRNRNPLLIYLLLLSYCEYLHSLLSICELQAVLSMSISVVHWLLLEWYWRWLSVLLPPDIPHLLPAGGRYKRTRLHKNDLPTVHQWHW